MFRKSILSWVLPVFALAALCFAMGGGQALADGASFSLSGQAQVAVGGIPNPAACKVPSSNAIPRQCYLAVDLTSTSSTYSDVDFTPGGPMTVGDIKTLSTDWNVGGSDCGGGSPRFSIETTAGNIFVYFGPTPNFTGCFYGWQSTGDVTKSTDMRVDTTQLGGPFYDNWAHAVSLAGSANVTGIAVVLDGGWTNPRGQDVTIDNFNINGTIMNGANVK